MLVALFSCLCRSAIQPVAAGGQDFFHFLIGLVRA